MSTLLIYAIKSAILLTLLLLPGILLLFREKMFRFNRATLLAIMVLSLVLPLCNVPFLSMDEVPAVQTIEIGLLQAGFPVEVMDYEVEAEQTRFPWFYVVSILYAIGVAVVLGIRLREIFSMERIIRRGSIWQKREADGIRIFCHADNVAPFSWLRSIVIGEQDYRDSGREIILHEKAHILHRHSLDILLLTLVEALQWWNPFVYLLGIYLCDIHEYQADDYVLRQGVSCHAYSQLIIRKAVGASSYTFANSFNHSLTKKRITMMLNPNPSPWRRSRALYVIPVAALALCAFATPEFKNASNLIEETVQIEDKVTESFADLQAEDEKNVTQTDTLLQGLVGRTPGLETGDDGTVYLNLGKARRLLVNDQEMIIAETAFKDEVSSADMLFIVDGKEMSSEKFSHLKPEDIKAVSMFKDEAAVAKYGEKGRNGVCVVDTKHSSAHDQPEVLPRFGDSDAAIWEFLMKNLRYPVLAMECGVTGRIIVGFVVETDGSVSEIKIVNSPNKPDNVRKVEGEAADAIVKSYTEKDGDEQYLSEAEWNSSLKALEEEAMRVVRLTSGKWTSGMNKGEKVRTNFTIPITFRLS